MGDIQFGDDDHDDYCEGDPTLDDVDLDKLVEVGDQVEAINAIEDDNERFEAAKRWALELGDG